MTEMFDILRASLFEDGDPVLTDWMSVFEEMKKQTVAGLPGIWLQNHPEAAPWLSWCRIVQAKWVQVMHAEDQLLKLLEVHDIPCVILKGAAAAMAYPHPALRSMGDVDFLVKRSDLESAASLLEKNGYILSHDKDACGHHYGYEKNHISFELHWRIPMVVETDEKRMLLFEEGIDKREWHEMEGYRFPVFPSVLNGLVLIFHIDQHLRSGLGLRQIIDWMMYINSLPAEQLEELIPLLKSTGVEKLALTVTVMCQQYLGLRKIVKEEASFPTEKLMAYILEQGNFGRKQGIDGNIASFGLSCTEKGGFFRRLQEGGLCRWKAVKKYPVLKPFAWIYQAFRILGIMAKNKKSPGKIVKQSRHGAERRQLIEALGLEMDRAIKG